MSSDLSRQFKYDISYIHLCSSSSNGILIRNTQTGQLPDGLIAQKVQHCTGVAEDKGLNPVQA